MAMGSEELLIFRITNHLKAIKAKTKTVEELPILSQIERLKGTNLAMAEEFENQLKKLTRGEKPKPKPKDNNLMNNSFKKKF